ncbi:macrophage mannose receptor 1-like [Pimephales promelas]|uniref:macrophage mannose receptor 1-like n=1 Tax=Pimephales promelas TaxID=90988 RepID=UPI001955C489|nr:macrophage mannose receptor 1-like [Pimephales promelas]
MKASVTLLLFLSLFEPNLSVYRYHFFVNVTMPWKEAQDHCRAHYDDLSTIRSKDLQMLSTNPKLKAVSFWIGLERDGKDNNKWVWSEGGEATITFWKDGEPNFDHEKCGAINKYIYKSFDANCTRSLEFYCMRVFELILVQQKSTWEEALLYCRNNHIDLAILNSEDIMEEAQRKSTAADTDYMWTGLRFIAGHWFWVNGEGMGYKVWSAGAEPKCPAMDQRCGVYDRTQNVWKPADCEQRLNFLCVKKGYKSNL